MRMNGSTTAFPLAFLAPLLFTAIAAAAPERAPGSAVTAVVVYPDRAQVTRTAAVPCGGARAAAVFAGIPPAADPTSIRAQSKEAVVDGVRWEERTREEGFAAEVKDIERQIRAEEGELAVVRDTRAREENSVSIAAQYLEVSLAMIGREMTEPAPGVAAWSAALESILATRLRASAEATGLAPRERAIGRKLDELRRRRDRLGAAAQRREYAAEVFLTCPAGKRAEVELSYVVGGASWEPAYEARAAESGGSGGGAGVDLATYATIRKATGEDWRDARVVLSTAIPRQNATPPEIAALKVWADERKPPKKVVTSRQESVRHADAPAGGKGAGSDSRVRFEAQGLSVQMTVPRPADVPGDGTPARLFVARTPLSADVKLRTSPKLMPFAFRVAELTNTAPFPLLPGPVDAFRRGALLGRHHMPYTAIGERFRLTFGIEEAIAVKRVVLEELQRQAGLFGGMRHHRFAYRFEIGNYLQRADEIEVSDHVPVSELDDIKVVIDGKTTGGYSLEPTDGIVTWRLRLQPGERRNVELVYRVEVPASYEQ